MLRPAEMAAVFLSSYWMRESVDTTVTDLFGHDDQIRSVGRKPPVYERCYRTCRIRALRCTKELQTRQEPTPKKPKQIIGVFNICLWHFSKFTRHLSSRLKLKTAFWKIALYESRIRSGRKKMSFKKRSYLLQRKCFGKPAGWPCGRVSALKLECCEFKSVAESLKLGPSASLVDIKEFDWGLNPQVAQY